MVDTQTNELVDDFPVRRASGPPFGPAGANLDGNDRG
jgi:hypothetical protein